MQQSKEKSLDAISVENQKVKVTENESEKDSVENKDATVPLELVGLLAKPELEESDEKSQDFQIQGLP